MTYNIAIIAAGGKGSRVGSDLPKQYQLLGGRPVLMYTLEAFEAIADKVILVIHREMMELWSELCDHHQFTMAHDISFGGKTRFESVRNGLHYIEQKYPDLISQCTAIAVHDAARPLVSRDLIRRSFDLCHQGFGNVLGAKSTDSVRIGTEKSSETINRNNVWLMQTPQTFPADLMIRAFAQEEQDSFTDEATVVEKLGYNILILESDPTNIKITYPEDFAIAQVYLQNLP